MLIRPGATLVISSVFILVAVTLATIARPLLNQGNHLLRVRVLMPNGSPLQYGKIRLEDNVGETVTDHITDSNGNFEVRSLNPGRYTIVVPSDERSYETATERVEIGRFAPDTVGITV